MRSRLFTVALCCWPALAAGGEAGQPDARPTPWHLVDNWWDLGEDVPFQSLSLDVEFSDDVPRSVNLYVAPVGLGHLSGVPFYGGIQTQADGYRKRDRRLRKIGPGFITSMWGERSHEAIRPSIGGFCQSSGHEGDFVSVRRPYDWKQGRYTYRLVRMDETEVDGKPATWVGAFVYSHAKDEHVFVGGLRFPRGELVLGRKLANFVEIYGPAIPVEKIPEVTVTFHPPVVNGKLREPKSVEAIYPEQVPDYARSEWRDGKLVVTVGRHVPERTERRVKLVPAKP